MFLRLIYQSFRRQRSRKLLAGVAITLGVSVATAMIAVAADIGDKMGRELRSYGANLVVYPQADTLDVEIGGVNLKPPSDGAFLNEADLPNIKSIFWRHNVLGFAPILPAKVEVKVPGSNIQKNVELLGTYFAKSLSYGKDTFTTGVRSTHPWWRVSGDWPQDNSNRVLVGERLAAQLGAKAGEWITTGQGEFPVAGIVSTGASEDDAIIAPLPVVQKILGHPGAVRRVFVSALTKPEDAFARRDPSTLSGAVFDRWYCSPYAQSIAFQLQQAVPHSKAEQIRQVAQNEGTVLSRIQGLMLLVTLAALLASALAVSAAMATAIFERQAEVGLMKALGAANSIVAWLFFAEAMLLALISGGLGFGLGSLMAGRIGKWIFGSHITVQPVLLPVVLTIAVAVTFAGSVASILRAMRFDPVIVLRGEP